MCLLVLSGCVVALPVTEDDVAKVDEKLGLGDTLTDMVHSQFDYEMNSDGQIVDKRIDGQFTIHIFTNEEKDEVEVVKDETSVTFGNAQVGKLTLPIEYESTSNPYEYSKVTEEASVSVEIDGFQKGTDDLATWTDFVEKTLTTNGYTDIAKTIDEENKQSVLSLQPDDVVYWTIYLKESEDRMYMTSIVYLNNNSKPSDTIWSDIMDNRLYE